MIHINLQEEQRGRDISPIVPQGGGGSAENVLFSVLQIAIVVLALLVAFGWNFMVNNKIEQLNEEIAQQEAELQKLKKVIELNKKLEQKRDLLRRKIEVISNLKRNQDLPVRMLDQLSKNLSEFLWLEKLSVSGRTLDLSGVAQNAYAHASFMRNLQNSPYFENVLPQSFIESRGLYDWRMRVDFVLPQEEQEPQQAARGGTS